MSQRKAKTPKRDRRKRKHVSPSDAPLGTEERTVTTIEERTVAKIKNSDNDNGKTTSESVPRRRESGRVDRRWEFYLISNMKEKLLNRTEKSVKATARRTGWHPTRTARSNLLTKHKKWFDIQWNYDDASEVMVEREGVGEVFRKRDEVLVSTSTGEYGRLTTWFRQMQVEIYL